MAGVGEKVESNPVVRCYVVLLEPVVKDACHSPCLAQEGRAVLLCCCPVVGSPVKAGIMLLVEGCYKQVRHSFFVA